MTNQMHDRRRLIAQAGAALMGLWLLYGTTGLSQEPSDAVGEAWASDSDESGTEEETRGGPKFVETALLQPQPGLVPPREIQPETPLPPAARALSARLFGAGTIRPSLLGPPLEVGALRPTRDIVFGLEGKARVTTDAGSLLQKSPAVLGVGVQRRTPIVHDPRVRASRVGQLAASGSHWVPARIDLDTMLSKIDSRIVSDMTVIKGPYSALYGPGIDFVDVQLLRSPRYSSGFESHGSTSFDYKVNGEQWYGRQALWGGDSWWGYRVGYGHRTGNDYRTGSGLEMPASYKSRDIDVALGARIDADSSAEFSYLRLDQTDVEFPGYAFDIDYLVTDGFEVEYTLKNGGLIDRLTVDAWYNRTRFEGNAQRPGKRRQFPFFELMGLEAFTDVDSTSTGFRLAASWGEDEASQLTAGADLRYIKQELNEIASGRLGFNIFEDANSPLPKSRWANPGLFVEKAIPVAERLSFVAGARADWLSTNVIDDPEKLAQLGIQDPPSSLADILGTDEFQQHFETWAAYLNGKYDLSPHWAILGAAGHGQRPPSLTELYVAQAFMFVLQNGQNSVTGDPQLKPERAWQIDLGVAWDYPRFRGGISGFHTWVLDYITFENLNVFRAPPAGQVEQVSVKYVNTELATLAGAELYCEYDWCCWLTPFATLRYVDGRDRTRDGDFATRRAAPDSPSERVPGLPRGSYSKEAGDPADASAEPLPGVPPLESRVGFRVHQACPEPRWSVELSARIVNRQDRVATSLFELPTPGFTVWDLRGVWQATHRLLLVGGVENFTDRNYREHLDFHPQPDSENLTVFQPGMNFYCGGELTY
jgi:outer membrane receptor protein involved in Fe transport